MALHSSDHEHDLNKLTAYVFDPDDPSDCYDIAAAVYHAAHPYDGDGDPRPVYLTANLHDLTAVYAPAEEELN